MKKQNPKFRDYVRRVAFNVSLSYNQIQSLLTIAEDMNNAIYMSHFVGGARKLRQIGLIEYKPPITPDYADRPIYSLTTEGKLMVELLKCAGYELFKLKESVEEEAQ